MWLSKSYLGTDVKHEAENDGGFADGQTGVDTKRVLQDRCGKYEQVRVDVDRKYHYQSRTTHVSILQNL